MDATIVKSERYKLGYVYVPTKRRSIGRPKKRWRGLSGEDGTGQKLANAVLMLLLIIMTQKDGNPSS